MHTLSLLCTAMVVCEMILSFYPDHLLCEVQCITQQLYSVMANTLQK